MAEQATYKLNATPIAAEDLLTEAKRLFDANYRLITYSVVDLDEENVDIIYHFDLDLEAVHYRLTHPKAQPIPSLSPVYFAAMLIENEARDQFNLTFDGLVLDFNRALYLDEEISGTVAAPFCKVSTVQKKA